MCFPQGKDEAQFRGQPERAARMTVHAALLRKQIAPERVALTKATIQSAILIPVS